MIVIRTDSNKQIATGHITRCMSIAEAAVDAGDEVVFAVSDKISAELVKKRGFDTHILNTRWDNLNSEAPIIIEYLKDTKPDIMLVDTYSVTASYLSKLIEYTNIYIIDDLMDENNILPCDGIINYAIYADKKFYEKYYSNARRLLGIDYAPLKKEYCNLQEKNIKKVAKDILLLTGGADEQHFSINMAKIISDNQVDYNDFTFHFVCGRYNMDNVTLMGLERITPNIKVYSGLLSLKELMEKCDVAASAGGSTLYELCACGTPTVTFATADNQMKNVHGFHDAGLMYYGGDVTSHRFSYERMLDLLTSLSRDEYRRGDLSKKTRELIDGRGSVRIYEGMKR